jgi:hypothetical protein
MAPSAKGTLAEAQRRGAESRTSHRHSRESGNLAGSAAQTPSCDWVPAFAGMTRLEGTSLRLCASARAKFFIGDRAA